MTLSKLLLVFILNISCAFAVVNIQKSNDFQKSLLKTNTLKTRRKEKIHRKKEEERKELEFT